MGAQTPRGTGRAANAPITCKPRWPTSPEAGNQLVYAGAAGSGQGHFATILSRSVGVFPCWTGAINAGAVSSARVV